MSCPQKIVRDEDYITRPKGPSSPTAFALLRLKDDHYSTEENPIGVGGFAIVYKAVN